ncbi:AEC family transporter [Bacillus licheniformis]|uniref:AEC family transporter n=1 Tax=Bacillus licheniformis TaxID=1402 RepID=A0A8B5YI74_BACLI|nr:MULTISPECIES: AEC family transporter [Bacillus]MBJ7888084.1 AEC family transporter [Bacillaceae bacterium HSR45]MBY8348327.1 AEC family transporter [Bacillus sp. PCH94]AMR12287.1 transporter [Bacillus licheniformis]ARC60770.1 putative transporter YfdV [Bacillus licheniformis]ARC63549.1 putative transporter YfdV [Bacillus licheniformis]
MSFLNILILLAPIFFVIALGWFAGHFGSYDAKSAKGVSTLVTKYALPAHFVSSILSTPKDKFYSQIPLMISLVIGIVGFYVIILLLLRFLFKYDLTDASMFSLNSAQPTFAFMGIPVLGSLFGMQEVAIPIAITGIVVNAMLDPLAIIVGTVGRSSKKQTETTDSIWKVTGKSILHGLSEPLAFAPLASIILVLFGLQIPELPQKMLDMLGNTTSGIALFAVGVTVGIRKIKFSMPALSIALLKVAAQPALMFVIAMVVGLSSADMTKAVLLVAFPGSAVAAMIATNFESQEAETASAFVISAVLSIISLPILIAITA